MSRKVFLVLLVLALNNIILSQTIPYESIADTLNSYTGTEKIDKAIQIGNTSEPWVIERIIMPELKYELAEYDLFEYYSNELKQDSLKDMLRVISLSYLKSSIVNGDSLLSLNKAEVYNLLLLQLYQNNTTSDTLKSYSLGKLLYLSNSETLKNFNFRESLMEELSSSNILYRDAAIKSLTRNFDELFISEDDYSELSSYLINILNSKKSVIFDYVSFFDLLSMLPKTDVLNYVEDLILSYYKEGDSHEDMMIKLIFLKSEILFSLSEAQKTNESIEKFVSTFNIIDIDFITYSFRLAMRSYAKQNEVYLDLIRYSDVLNKKLAYLKSLRLIGKTSQVGLDKERLIILLNDEDITVKINSIKVLPFLFSEVEMSNILSDIKSTENNTDILEFIAQYIGY